MHSRQSSGALREEGAARRAEEAELAAKVGSRRAAAAEAEVERLQRQLHDTEKRAESLAWQVGSESCGCCQYFGVGLCDICM